MKLDSERERESGASMPSMAHLNRREGLGGCMLVCPAPHRFMMMVHGVLHLD